jgi:hypothetical protein
MDAINWSHLRYLPDLIYKVPTFLLVMAVVAVSCATAIHGFKYVHRIRRRFQDHDGLNDAISGAMGALGVFYGVTVGLIAIDVWQRHARAEDIVAREAAAILSLYSIVESHMGPSRDIDLVANTEEKEEIRQKNLPNLVAEYLQIIICTWNQQKDGKFKWERLIGTPGRGSTGTNPDWRKLRMIRAKLQSFDPGTYGEKERYAAAMHALANLGELRRLRGDAANDELSWVMWLIILSGGAMSIFVVYLFRLEDVRLHKLIVGVVSSFLGLVFVMIVINNRPFLGESSLEPDSYREISWIVKKEKIEDCPKATENVPAKR